MGLVRKIFFKSLSAIILLLSLNVTVFAFYNDVPESHPYYQEIKTLYDENRLPQEANFNPDQILLRPELFKLIIAYSQVPLSENIKLPYTDTDNNASYAKYLQTALDLKILNPFTESHDFNTQLQVTKFNALTNFFKALGVGNNYFFDKQNFPFKDVDTNSHVAQTAFKAFELSILETDQPSYFRMAKRITKAEAAHYLYQIKHYIPGASITVEIPTPKTPQNTNSTQFNKSEQELINNNNFDILLDVWSAIKKDYFYQDEINDEKLILGAIQGMADQLGDIYTSFNQPEDAALLLNQLSSNFQGIGIIIEAIENNITVVSPLKESPAEIAGIKAKDIIIGIDNENIIGQSLNEVANKIKGPEGTKVKIKVLRNGKELQFELTRSFILKKSVFEEILNKDSKKIGYISLINFGEDTYNEMLEASTALLSQDIDGLIIDLRNNPGGYLDVAVNILGLFTVDNKIAVKLKDPKGNITEIKTVADGRLASLKVVILINEGSASASEIMAGALKDYDLAELVGTKSFGKGSVQELKQYSNNSLFKFTSAKWLTPNGHEIDKIGISPDKIVENSKTDQDQQLEAALAEF